MRYSQPDEHLKNYKITKKKKTAITYRKYHRNNHE